MKTTTHDAHRVQHQDTPHDGDGGLRRMAASATLHCLTGCALGEILGLLIGTALGLSSLATLALAVTLAFAFGYSLSLLPLLSGGLALATALRLVLAADTLSIATMEVVDNAVMAVVPGAMGSGLVNPVFWTAMAVALTAAFVVAYPVNRYLLGRGKGHALTHQHHAGDAGEAGEPVRVLQISPATLAVAIAAFLLGGLLVSLAAQ